MVETDIGVALVAGGCAGLSVDVSLFPLDTLKTRLQSEHGFVKSGGFRGVYSGLFSVVLGSVPTASLFFLSYETTKKLSARHLSERWAPASHMVGASLGEATACLVRVPVEVVKQRAQASPSLSSVSVFRSTVTAEGFYGLYRGYFSTVIREVPFSFIQFPIWEYLKLYWRQHQSSPLEAWQSAVCGAISGGIASGITTPLDVAKTRIMLAERGSLIARGNIWEALQSIHAQSGVKGLFSGIIPRVLWTSIGGAIFLGMYDKVKTVLTVKHSRETDG